MTKKSTTKAAEEISLDELAAITRRSKTWLNTLAKQGYFKSERYGTYRLGNAVAGIIHYYEDKLKERSAATQTTAQTETQQARAELLRIKIAKEKRELISFRETSDSMQLVLGTLRAEFDGLSAGVTRDIELRGKIDTAIESAFGRACKNWDRELNRLKSTEDDGDEENDDNAPPPAK